MPYHDWLIVLKQRKNENRAVVMNYNKLTLTALYGGIVMAKKKLLIVESPSEIKAINKFLGNDFKIMSTVGHMIDLRPVLIGITINDSIELEYTVIPDKKIIVANLCKAVITAHVIFLATDSDREGEIISWHVEAQIKPSNVKNKKNICRISV